MYAFSLCIFLKYSSLYISFITLFLSIFYCYVVLDNMIHYYEYIFLAFCINFLFHKYILLIVYWVYIIYMVFLVWEVQKMALSEARKRANAKYNAKSYERLGIDVKKGERNKLKQYAEQKEISLNKFVCNCVSHCIENDIDVSAAKPLGEVLPENEET